MWPSISSPLVGGSSLWGCDLWLFGRLARTVKIESNESIGLEWLGSEWGPVFSATHSDWSRKTRKNDVKQWKHSNAANHHCEPPPLYILPMGPSAVVPGGWQSEVPIWIQTKTNIQTPTKITTCCHDVQVCMNRKNQPTNLSNYLADSSFSLTVVCVDIYSYTSFSKCTCNINNLTNSFASHGQVITLYMSTYNHSWHWLHLVTIYAKMAQYLVKGLVPQVGWNLS